MLTIRRAATYSFILVSSRVYGQSNLLERRAADSDWMQTSAGAEKFVAAITTTMCGEQAIQ
jgi:hypothetical protein